MARGNPGLFHSTTPTITNTTSKHVRPARLFVVISKHARLVSVDGIISCALNSEGKNRGMGNNNVNENGGIDPTITMNNVNDNVLGEKYRKGRNVEVIADALMAKLRAKPESRPFMCKVAWKLSDVRIWYNLEAAQKGHNPIGLFIYLCKRDGV